MPVDGMVPVTVSCWFTSILAADMVGVDGAVSLDFTVIVLEADDVVVSAVVALSVTCSSKLYVSPEVSVFADMLHVTVLPAFCADPVSTAHCVAVT